MTLGYPEIRAQIAGRISRADFSVGNLVGPDTGVLATIVSQDPTYVTFPVSQRELLAHRGERDDPVVSVTLPDATLYEHPGKLNFIDVQVEPGTDRLRCAPSCRTRFACWSPPSSSGFGSNGVSPSGCSRSRRRRFRSIRPARTCWSSATMTGWRSDGSGWAHRRRSSAGRGWPE